MSESNELGMPEVVSFKANGFPCKAYCLFGQDYGLNMGSAVINFRSQPKVSLEYLPHAARVTLDEGLVWFDTDSDSAAAIESLFQTGRAPRQ